MEVVDDDDHVGGLDAEPRILVFEIVLLSRDVKTSPRCFSANGFDRLAISIDRANGQTTPGEPQRMSTPAARHIKGIP